MSNSLNDPASLSAVGVWSLNIFSSVGVILSNKAVLKTFNFSFATTLTALHFCVTATGGLLAQHMGLLSAKRVPWSTVFWFSLIADASIVSLNLSLMYNSVGFYQIAKLSVIPTCCFLEWLINGKHFSWEVKGSVAVVLAGVGVCTITDVGMTPFGLVAAVVAVLSTALQQIYIAKLQKTHGVGSFDLLNQTAPIQAATLIMAGPFVDFWLTEKNVLTYQVPILLLPALLASCILALFVNLSTYLCIGKFSAVTFQVMGNMKTVLVLVMGWILFDAPLTLKNLVGLFLAIMGMVLYSWAIEVEKLNALSDAGTQPSPAKEGVEPHSPLAEEGTALLEEGKKGHQAEKENQGDRIPDSSSKASTV